MSPSPLYGLVFFSAALHASWNSLVKSAGDRILTIAPVLTSVAAFVLLGEALELIQGHG